jgi:hypothetical protein
MIMTTKPKTRKAPAANGAELDPVFAAITEHKVLIKESDRLEDSFMTAMAKAEKKYGKWARAPDHHSWPGEATISPFYDRWNRADRAERKAAMRMARTEPATAAGVAALIAHARRVIVARSSEGVEDWLLTALKTAASALTRIDAA